MDHGAARAVWAPLWNRLLTLKMSISIHISCRDIMFLHIMIQSEINLITSMTIPGFFVWSVRRASIWWNHHNCSWQWLSVSRYQRQEISMILSLDHPSILTVQGTDSLLAVASSAQCVFRSSSRALYSPVTFLGQNSLTCVAPKLCTWTTDGIIGGSPANGTSGSSNKLQAPARGTPCIFPFIFKDQIFFSCQMATAVPGFLQEFGKNLTSSALNALNNGEGFCSVTGNLTADKSWGGCECRGPATGGLASGRPPTGQWLFGVAFNGFFVRSMSAGLQR